MTVLMRKDMDEKCLLELPASSAFGDGTLYVTDHAVAYEVFGRGIYLNFVPLDMLSGLYVLRSGMFGTKCRLEWREEEDEDEKEGDEDEKNGGKSTHSIELRVRRYGDLESYLQ